MPLQNNIDEINVYPNGDGTFEMNIQCTLKDANGEIKNATIKFSKMMLSMELYGGIGSSPGIKITLEGNKL